MNTILLQWEPQPWQWVNFFRCKNTTTVTMRELQQMVRLPLTGSSVFPVYITSKITMSALIIKIVFRSILIYVGYISYLSELDCRLLNIWKRKWMLTWQAKTQVYVCVTIYIYIYKTYMQNTYVHMRTLHTCALHAFRMSTKYTLWY